MTSSIRDAIRAARERLRALGLPEDPTKRWIGLERGMSRAQIRRVVNAGVLYNIITSGEQALAAQAAGDWEGSPLRMRP